MPPVRPSASSWGRARTRGVAPVPHFKLTGRAEPCLTSGGEAGMIEHNSSMLLTHIGRLSRNNRAQFFPAANSHRRRSRNDRAQFFPALTHIGGEAAMIEHNF